MTFDTTFIFLLVLLGALIIIVPYLWWMRRQKALYERVVDTVMRDSVIIVDHQNQIVDMNTHAQQFLGVSTDAIGKPVATIIPDFSSLLNNMGQDVGKEVTRMSGDLETFYEFSFSPLSRQSRVIVLRDITMRKRAEEELRRAANAFKLMELKDRFISAVTHELRTPLVSVKGYLDFILMGEAGTVPWGIEQNLQVVKRNADQLLNLTDDLLDVRRLESGKLQLNLKPMNLLDVARHCYGEIQPFVKEKKQKISLDAPERGLPIAGDNVRLNQSLMNLLINASKFTPEKGQIAVKVSENTDYYEVRVSDTGIGIKSEDLQRVFEPFATIVKPAYVKGTGLGLSVTKGLIEAHGGKIWAESPGQDKGATFIFTLPKRKPVAWGT